jgi:hypothetical protein
MKLKMFQTKVVKLSNDKKCMEEHAKFSLHLIKHHMLKRHCEVEVQLHGFHPVTWEKSPQYSLNRKLIASQYPSVYAVENSELYPTGGHQTVVP